MIDEKIFAARFWSRVDVRGKAQCWEWKDALFPTGYGHLSIRGRSNYAHRVAYRLWHGDIPAGMQVMHSCDNPKCVNPHHLSLGTARDNAADSMAKGRRRKSKNVSWADVCEMRELRGCGVSLSKIAARFKTSTPYVQRIVNMKSRVNS